MYVPTLPTLIFLKIVFLGGRARIGDILALALLRGACVSSYSPFCIRTDPHTFSFDDAQLAMTVSRLPPRGILLIEDIDCAFPSRDDDDVDEPFYPMPQQQARRRWANSYHRSQITLSGLLNVLDGIGSGMHRWPSYSSN